MFFLQHFRCLIRVTDRGRVVFLTERVVWMCVNRIFYGEDAICRIERREDGSRNWLTAKEQRKVKKVSLWKISKQSLDLRSLLQFPNLEVVEISGYDELQPLELQHVEVLYQFRKLKCLRLCACHFDGELDTTKWKRLRTFEID